MFFKKKSKSIEKCNIYSPIIKEFGNIYCNTVTYTDDKIDLSKVPNLYVTELIYDGYDFDEDFVDLFYSMCLFDADGNIWGCISVAKPFTVGFKKPNNTIEIDNESNLSNNRLMITNRFPFRMTSMFYKENDGYYFYAKSKSSLGIYICIHITQLQFLHMNAVISNLCSRITVEHRNFIFYNMADSLKKTCRISFIQNFEVLSFTTTKNNKALMMLLSINNEIFMYMSKLNLRNIKKFIYNCKNSELYLDFEDFDIVLSRIRSQGCIVYMIDNIIRCGYLRNTSHSEIENIITVHYCVEDLIYRTSKILSEEDKNKCIRYIQFDGPAIDSAQESIKSFITSIYAKVSIE